jgi:hypothetical protein
MVRSLSMVFALLAAPETAVAQAFEDKLELCMSCHGDKGISSVQGVPSIAGRTLTRLYINSGSFDPGSGSISRWSWPSALQIRRSSSSRHTFPRRACRAEALCKF